jgi:hypothetical protein
VVRHNQIERCFFTSKLCKSISYEGSRVGSENTKTDSVQPLIYFNKIQSLGKMETNQEKYYRAKINDRDRVKQRENSAQTLIFLMYMAIGLILFCFSLLVISPGALILLYVYPMIPNGLSPLQAWIVGISLSIGIIGILFLKTRSWKKTAGFYSVLVFICVLVSFFVPAQLEGTTLADSAWVVFSPFRKAPLQTTTSSSHLAAKMFTQKSHQDNVSISPAKINMNGSNFSHQVAQPHGVSLEDTSQVDETNTHQPSFDCSKSTNQLMLRSSISKLLKLVICSS